MTAPLSGWRASLARLLGGHEPPQRVAGSFAVAIFCGTAPMFVGLFLLLPLLKILKLSRFVGIGVTALLAANPFGIFIMVGQVWLGLKLLGHPAPGWRELAAAVRGAVRTLWTGGAEGTGGGAALDLLGAFLLGGFLSSFLAAGLVYLAVWRLLERRRLAAAA